MNIYQTYLSITIKIETASIAEQLINLQQGEK